FASVRPRESGDPGREAHERRPGCPPEPVLGPAEGPTRVRARTERARFNLNGEGSGRGRRAGYQPRKATTVLLRCRRSAMIEQAPDALSCSPRPAPAWLPPTKPMAVIPAAVAAATPGGESSTTMQFVGEMPMRLAACRNRSGAGLPLGTSLAENTRGSKNRISPAVSRLARMRSWVAEEATHFGPRSQVSA